MAKTQQDPRYAASQIKALEDKCAKLQKQLEKSERREIVKLKERLRNTEERLSSEQSARARLENEQDLEAKKAEAKDLRRQIADSKQNNANLYEDLKAAKSELKEREKDFDDAIKVTERYERILQENGIDPDTGKKL